MRRLLALLALVAFALVLTGCSTAEGLRAQELLKQAEAAQAALTSSTFEGSLGMTFGGERMAMSFRGATSSHGEWVSVDGSGIPGAGSFSMQMLVKDGRAWTNLGGSWVSGPAPAGVGANGTVSAAAFQELAQYVEDVRVTEHQLVEGKQVTTIAGEIDTQGMLEAFTKLGSAAGEVEGLSLEGFDLSKLGVDVGDIEAVLTIDEATGLLSTAMITFGMSAQGEELSLELRYRLTSANEPVRLPSP